MPNKRITIFLPAVILATFPLYFLFGASHNQYLFYSVTVFLSGLYSTFKVKGRLRAIPIAITIIGTGFLWIFLSEPIHYFQ